MDLEAAIKHRRSIYALAADIQISNDRVEELLHCALSCTPTSFNSQSPCTVLLLKEEHHKLWHIVMETLRGIVPADKFPPTEEKINSFDAAYATILFFEDSSVTEQLIKENPLYKDQFRTWAMQHNGMLMCNVWTMLEAEGLGASLQHYNPLIDEEVKRQWHLPDSWTLLAQMPFGRPLAAPEEKEHKPISQRYRQFG